ncbi:hypothetical protein DFH28DRAFT_931742 [Melampsora americana]|nr:hypothetical protein DFH28DRAFT_931742 [Melampsora americana]
MSIIFLTSMLTKASTSEPSIPTPSSDFENSEVIDHHLLNTWNGYIRPILVKDGTDGPIHLSSSIFDGRDQVQVRDMRDGLPLPSLTSIKKTSELSKRFKHKLVKRMPIKLAADEGKRSIIPQKLLRIPKLIAGLDYESLPVIKMKSQLEDYFKPSPWLKHIQRILRQITSKAIANGVVGTFWGMVISEGDDSGGIFRQIIMWAPIGMVVKRAEVDLHSDFPEILVAYVNTDSSAGITKHTVNSFDRKTKDDKNPVDQYLSYQFTIHRSTDRSSREELKSDLDSDAQEDEHQNVFSRAFEFWLSAVLHKLIYTNHHYWTIDI